MKQKHQRLSKFLSYVLRHKPEAINLSLDSHGWANINDLIEQANANGTPLSHTLLQEVVHTSDKQRFIISEDGKNIRANQGHSININLELTPQTPPEILFHGTAQKNLESIMKTGLLKKNRQYVHLSFEKETARKVGSRHGKAVILVIKAKEMQAKGFSFYLSENQVWLSDHIPPEFISQES